MVQRLDFVLGRLYGRTVQTLWLRRQTSGEPHELSSARTHDQA